MKHYIIIMIILLQSTLIFANAKIIEIQGDIKIRRGLEEIWENASLNSDLKETDTILSDENSKVVLQLPDGNRFTMGSYSILDISDLRLITEKELFLFLTARKIRQLPDVEDTPAQPQNVSTVRASDKSEALVSLPKSHSRMQTTYAVNSAIALYNQKFYPNAILKIYTIIEAYHKDTSLFELYYYLGKSFEALNKNDHALEAYTAARACKDDTSSTALLSDIKLSIKRIKQIESGN